MSPIVSALLETLGVVLVATASAGVGWWCSKCRRAVWAVAYAAAFLLVLAMGIPRWMPQIESIVPFSWIMAGRTEFAVMALICTMLLTIPLAKLPQNRLKVLVAAFMALFIGRYSVLPFLAPALNYGQLSRIETRIDGSGVCRQTTGYTCGPAAAVTALQSFGITAHEGPLAIRAHTNWVSGTPMDSLCTAIRDEYGRSCRPAYFDSISDLRGRLPVIAVIKWGFMVDHYVVVLSVTDSEVVVGDPSRGKYTMTHAEFEDKWRRCGIVFDDGEGEIR